MVAAPRVRYQSEPMNSGPVSSPTYASMPLAPPSPGVNWSLIARALRAAGTHRHRHRAAVMITCTVLGRSGCRTGVMVTLHDALIAAEVDVQGWSYAELR